MELILFYLFITYFVYKVLWWFVKRFFIYEEYENELATDSSNIEFVFPGDFNLDSDVNILDLVGAIQHIIYGIPASDLALAGADYNYDGDVNILDLVATIQFIIFGQYRYFRIKTDDYIRSKTGVDR